MQEKKIQDKTKKFKRSEWQKQEMTEKERKQQWKGNVRARKTEKYFEYTLYIL